jgi:RimJ/RimL family protein N-acetyltransferase
MTAREVGPALPGWVTRERPSRVGLQGSHCQLEPLDPDRHGRALFDANQLDTEGANWTYLAYGPFPDYPSYRAWLDAVSATEDPLFFAVTTGDGAAVGVASLMRVDPPCGVIEVGHIHYSLRLQRTPASTEAMYLLMRHVFESLGYRRYVWKCDALNAPSRRAAERLGFTYEGTFRQAAIYKGRNRDTAWYSVIDSEWPARRAAFERWLAPDNFDAHGRQRSSL